MNFNALITLAADSTTQQGGWQSWLVTGLMLVGVLVVGYFFIIRPQKKQEKEATALRNSLQVGDEVTTIGGIIGKVVSIKGETFVLETTRDKTKIRFLKGAIRTVDVRAEDIAASVMEAKKETEAPADAKAENATDEKTETTDENK